MWFRWYKREATTAAIKAIERRERVRERKRSFLERCDLEEEEEDDGGRMMEEMLAGKVGREVEGTVVGEEGEVEKGKKRW